VLVGRHVIEVMGTVFSLDLREPVEASALQRVTADLQWIDATFSTYRPDSQVSRLGAGHLRLEDAAPELTEVLDLCASYSAVTRGYFTANLQGRLDPSGLVKGWAIRRACNLLVEAGSHRHMVNGGGDVQTVGDAGAGRPWGVAVVDPHRPGQVATVVYGTGIAVATSGTAERGEHILNPFTGRPATELSSVTVVGPDIVAADVYATAAVAQGGSARSWVETLSGYDAYAVTRDGAVWATPGFARYTLPS